MIPVCINNLSFPPVRQAPGRKSAVEQEKCGGVGVSRLGNSTLTQVPGKVKSRPYIIESFAMPNQDASAPPVRQAPGRKSAVEQEECGGVGVSRWGW